MKIGAFHLMPQREPRADRAKAAALAVRSPRQVAAEGSAEDRR